MLATVNISQLVTVCMKMTYQRNHSISLLFRFCVIQEKVLNICYTINWRGAVLLKLVSAFPSYQD